MTPPSTTGQPSPSAEKANYSASQQSEDMIGSLENAFAGVNLSGLSQSYEKSSDRLPWANAPFPPNGQAPPAPSNSSFSNGQRVPSRQNLLFGTDMKDLSERSSPVKQSQGLDLFLSQSPSQTLGEDVLKLQQSLGDGRAQNPQQATLNGFSLNVGKVPAPIGAQNTNTSDGNNRRKNESPLGSVTATSTSSRSGSPSLFNNNNNNNNNDSDHRRPGGTIQAFGGHDIGISAGHYDNNPSPHSNRTVNHIPNMGGQPIGLSHFNGDRSFMRSSSDIHQHPVNLPISQGIENQYQIPQPPQQPMHHPPPQPTVASAPQVLYMAVPTPDGRGQMLHPVQMVQIPGQPPSFVLPAAGNIAAPQMGIDAAAPPPQMMVLPSPVPQPSPPQPAGMVGGMADKNWNMPGQYSRNGLPDRNQYAVDNRADDYLGTRLGGASSPRSSLGANNGADAIASLYSAPKRPPLDALLGHVRRLSRDQVGCRLLQQALDEEGPMAASLILNEGISFWGEAMVDPFGNYLFQKILEKITADERIMLIKSVSARLVNASLNLHGTRSVQKVVELCAVDESTTEAKENADGTSADILTRALTPAAARLCIDSHGNHVIQRILLKLGHKHAKFVFDAVAASVGDVARHRHGCCVIQRCLDSPPSDARSHLVHRIVEKCLELMQDAYGNYVVQYVLDVCGDEDVHQVCDSVVGKVCLLAIQKFSSNVMEKCLERCRDQVKEMYLAELSDPDRIRELMMDPFGNYVVQRALSVATHAQAIRLVEAMRPHLISSQPGTPHGQRNGGMRNTAGGRRIMAKICRRFPNFTLTALGSPEELYSQHKGHHRKNMHTGMAYSALSPGPQNSPYASPHQRRQPPPPQGQMRQPYFDAAGSGGYHHDQYQNGYAPYPPM